MKKLFMLVVASFLFALTCAVSVRAESVLHTTSLIERDNIEIIAHRGASGFLPEHTKEAAVLSFMQGAHYIEQDLVATKDSQLVVLHDIYLEAVTNVETLFTNRKRDDGRYYVIDFTLEELRSLSVHERENAQQQPVFPSRYKGSGHFTISTFAEHVELIQQLNLNFGKNVGLYPEIKAPNWHMQQGTDITALLVNALYKHDLNSVDAKIYLQSFDPTALKRLRNEFKVKPKLVQLIASNSWAESSVNFDHLRSPEGLKGIAEYAHGIGLSLPRVINFTNGESDQVIAIANSLNLFVHAYTFRSDVLGLTRPPEQVFKQLKQSGIQGLFTDQVMPYMFDE